jgi:hypothetical protein
MFPYRLLALFFLLLTFSHCGSGPAEAPPATEPAIDLETLSTLPTATSDKHFLFLADIHLDTERNHTYQGQDTGLDLWNAAKEKLAEVMSASEPPAFILYTGDLPCHHPSSGPQHDANIKQTLTDLRKLAGDTPLFYAPGNNDGLGGDYYPFTNTSGQTPLSLVPNLDFPAPNASMVSNPHPEHGYYSARPVSGLRVIALNTVLLGTSYYGATQSERIAAGDSMLVWLNEQLISARDTVKEQVYIIMHIPPGTDAHSGGPMWDTHENNKWQRQFLEMAATYEPTISGIFYGHTHMDELRLLTAGSSYTELALSSPGISPNHGQNPGFKTVSYQNDFQPTGFTTHYTNRDSTVWGASSYDFSEVYGCTKGTILSCLRSMTVSEIEQGLQATYKAFNGTGSPPVNSGLFVK